MAKTAGSASIDPPASQSDAAADDAATRMGRLTRQAKDFVNARLAKQQFISTLVLSASVGVVTFLVYLSYMANAMYSDFKTRADETYLVVRNALPTTILDYDGGMASNIISGLMIRRDIYRAVITDNGDLILGSFTRQPMNGALAGVSREIFGQTQIFSYPIYDKTQYGLALDEPFKEEGRIGTIKFHMDTEVWMHQFLTETSRLAVISLSWTFLIAMLVSLLFYRNITRPIVLLSRSIARIDPESPDERDVYQDRRRGEDEIRTLSSAVETLISKLRQTLNNQRRSQNRLRRLADTDPMTGLMNRRAFFETASALIDDGAPFCLLLFDIDYFKSVNDAYGHDVGDAVIIDVAKSVQSQLRASDSFARVGGEEFAVILPGAPEAVALEAAQRIRHRVANACAVPKADPPWRITISIGVAQRAAAVDETIEEAMKRADEALYAAKKAGRNCVELAAQAVGAETSTKTMSAAIQTREAEQALDAGELELACQPKTAVSDDGAFAWTGVEALLRWRRPGHGLLSPAAFLPLIETGPRGDDLNRWTIEEAAPQCARWRDGFGVVLPIAVNLSATWIEDADIAEIIAEALRKHGLPAHALEIEITETDTLSDSKMAAQTLHALATQGVRVAIDDFGAGFSSLTRLLSLPISRIKIDRAFVVGMQDQARSTPILRSIITLGRDIGVDVLAEGVETYDQLAWLLAHGCRHMQGFYFERPTTAARVSDYLANAAPGRLALDIGIAPHAYELLTR